MMDVKSMMSNVAKSEAEVNDEELIEILDGNDEKLLGEKLSEMKSDLNFDGDVIGEYKTLRKSPREKNNTSYRELSHLIEKSEHNQSNREIGEIYRSWKYEENVVNSCDDYEREEEEEELYSSGSGSIEKLEEKAPDELDDVYESDYNYFSLLDDTPAEILRDRGAIIEKIGELRNVLPELKRKNRLLQYWVFRAMTKKHQTMTPEYETLCPTVSEMRYIKRLITCKTTIDEIEARQRQINDETNIMENRTKNILEEDKKIFEGFSNREREIGVGLILEKSGRVLSSKTVDAMIRRQLRRRELLNRNRFKYIVLQHRYEDLKMELRLVETLGEGMTIMDYDVIQLINFSLRDKLEERERELEKLFVKVQQLLNALSNHKEKDIFHQADIYHEKNRLKDTKLDTQIAREILNTARCELMRVRDCFAENRRRGGMLFALPVLREMEKTLKRLNDLRTEIEGMVQQVRFNPVKKKKKKKREEEDDDDDEGEVRTDETSASKLDSAEARTSVTRMTKVKRSESRNKPGRC